MYLFGRSHCGTGKNTVNDRLFMLCYFGPDLRRLAQIAQPDKP